MKIAATNNQLLSNPTINSSKAERCGTPALRDNTKEVSFREQMLAIDKNKTERCGTPTLKDKTKEISFQDQINVIKLNSNKVNLLVNKKVL